MTDDDRYFDIEAVMDLQDIIASLQDMEDDEFEERGLSASPAPGTRSTTRS